MQQRLISELRKLAIILVIGIIYYIWVLFTDLRIPCLFEAFTGFLCPGCGVTRMIMSATKLDFVAAYSYNKLLFVTWPLVLIPLAYSEINYIKNGSRDTGPTTFLIITETVLLLVFGIVRNII